MLARETLRARALLAAKFPWLKELSPAQHSAFIHPHCPKEAYEETQGFPALRGQGLLDEHRNAKEDYTDDPQSLGHGVRLSHSWLCRLWRHGRPGAESR